MEFEDDHPPVPVFHRDKIHPRVGRPDGVGAAVRRPVAGRRGRRPLFLGLLAALAVAFGAVAMTRYERRRRAASYRNAHRTEPAAGPDGPATVPASPPTPEAA